MKDVLFSGSSNVCVCTHLDTRWHGYVKVTQYMLCVLVLGAFPQKG